MGKLEKWLAAKREMLLPGDHYHLIFTVPRQFRLLWQWNPRTFGDLLFTVSASTLRSLLGQERRLGDAKPGWIAALHTWGRTLIAHPHLHVLITGGGLLPDGTWRAIRNGYLLPFRQVRHVFRQRFCDALEAKLRAGELELPDDLSLEKALRIVAKARRIKWNVRVEAPYRHGDGVATYLARYLKGGPIKNHRLVSFDGETVRFRYGDFREADASGEPKWKVLELSVEEFLRRLILHIPLPGLRPAAGRGHRQRGALRSATTGPLGGLGRMRDLDRPPLKRAVGELRPAAPAIGSSSPRARWIRRTRGSQRHASASLHTPSLHLAPSRVSTTWYNPLS
jgi:hypothetical protein